eukprot:COSAG01_NODE_11346_length_1952_cov_9.007551_4_plen_57_part_01
MANLGAGGHALLGTERSLELGGAGHRLRVLLASALELAPRASQRVRLPPSRHARAAA